MPTFNEDPVVSSDDGTAVWGKSSTWVGVFGESQSTTGGHGVLGQALGTGVAGVSKTWVGVYGESSGSANGPAAIWGDGKDGAFGVKGHARAQGAAGVAGYSLTNRGPGIYGQGNPAGQFDGDVIVTGDLVLTGGDVAEEFDIAQQVVDPSDVCPGTVVVLDRNGALAPCSRAYDTSVAGAVAGAGDRAPALVLDRHQRAGQDPVIRPAVAITGKVWCRADASFKTIRVGDMLTTSSTHGHAMVANDRDAAFGAVLGKALTPLSVGTGLVLTLVGLA